MADGGSLYDEDLVRWSAEQAAALRAAAASGTNLPLDWENLAEEIDTVGRSQRTELRSRTRTLVEHLLKLACSSAVDPRRGWKDTVRRTRVAVRDLIEESPSLERELPTILDHVQPEAGRLTAESLDDAGEGKAAVEAFLRSGGLTAEQVFGPWFPADLSGDAEGA